MGLFSRRKKLPREEAIEAAVARLFDEFTEKDEQDGASVFFDIVRATMHEVHARSNEDLTCFRVEADWDEGTAVQVRARFKHRNPRAGKDLVLASTITDEGGFSG